MGIIPLWRNKVAVLSAISLIQGRGVLRTPRGLPLYVSALILPHSSNKCKGLLRNLVIIAKPPSVYPGRGLSHVTLR